MGALQKFKMGPALAVAVRFVWPIANPVPMLGPPEKQTSRYKKHLKYRRRAPQVVVSRAMHQAEASLGANEMHQARLVRTKACTWRVAKQGTQVA